MFSGAFLHTTVPFRLQLRDFLLLKKKFSGVGTEEFRSAEAELRQRKGEETYYSVPVKICESLSQYQKIKQKVRVEGMAVNYSFPEYFFRFFKLPHTKHSLLSPCPNTHTEWRRNRGVKRQRESMTEREQIVV